MNRLLKLLGIRVKSKALVIDTRTEVQRTISLIINLNEAIHKSDWYYTKPE